MSSSKRYKLESNRYLGKPKLGVIIHNIVEKRKLDWIEEYGIHLGAYLGSGYDGCVYECGQNRVIKFTFSLEEADLSEYLMEIGDEEGLYEGFPVIDDVFIIPITNFKNIYAIIKENILDLDTLEDYTGYVDIANYLCSFIQPNEDINYVEEKVLGAARDIIINMSPELEIMEFAYFLIRCAANQIYIYDLIADNLGVRYDYVGAHLIVRDYSACEFF